MRNRMIKPEFWTDEKVLQLSDSAKCLFIGLWNFSDDEGLVRNSPTEIKTRILPLYPTPIEPLLEELISKNLIFTIKIPEKSYFLINNFNKHQRIDKPTTSEILKEIKYYLSSKTRIGLLECSENARRMLSLKINKIKINKINITPPFGGEKKFVFSDYLQVMENDKRRHVQIIALYWKIKKIQFSSLEQVQGELKEGRLTKAASALTCYEDDKIWNTMDYLQNKADFKWTLETVKKYINEDLNKLSRYANRTN